jgi:hypothetical protein
MVPVWHWLLGVQAALCVHALHVPEPQTSFGPHGIPFGRSAAGAHTGIPLEQSMVPALHWTEGVHDKPGVQLVASDASATAPTSAGEPSPVVAGVESEVGASSTASVSPVAAPSCVVRSAGASPADASSPTAPPGLVERSPLAQDATRATGTRAQTAASIRGPIP